MKLVLCHPSGTQNFEFSPRFLENFYTSVYYKPVLQYDNYVSVILNQVIYGSNIHMCERLCFCRIFFIILRVCKLLLNFPLYCDPQVLTYMGKVNNLSQNNGSN